jgi:hypothetical protein
VPSEYTGTATAPPPTTVAPNVGASALDTNARAPEPDTDALGKVATVKLVVAGMIAVLES